jgi:hypothetical protein
MNFNSYTNYFKGKVDSLFNDGQLYQHGFFVSQNGHYYARLQDDGNFVVYNGNDFTAPNAVWSSNTGGVGYGPFKLVMQNDGNLCIYEGNGNATWSSNTWHQGVAPYKLVMQDDRNLVLYDSHNKAVWSSNTYTNQNSNSVAFGKSHRTDTLHNDWTIYQHGFFASNNGQYFARVQDDGNFVLYHGHDFQGKNAIWASNTGGVGYGPFKLVMQNDGNLCLYEGSGKCTWSTNTWQKGVAPYRLVMQDDRNLVLYDTYNKAVWATGTNI